MKKYIKEILNKKIKIEYIKIYNISHIHKKFGKKNSHFKIIIVSNDFLKINILRRHQIIYNILFKKNKKKIYGIEIFTYTKKEWKKNKKNCYSIKCIKKIIK
ncbi:DNA-binding transcriptional regulator BolA [Buchnera aphidicola (Periphyllus testudinaceus)]|uniref:BolA/IbaG family iron-sulfur metabolism protein n=1 Tax=Buchnera aphidicola TaxID=9 RepID=UPI003464207B